MDLFVLKLFLPETFLSATLLFNLVLNSLLINTFNYPLINKELFYQFIFTIVCLLALYLNLKTEGFFINALFDSNQNSKIIKICITTFILLVIPLLLQNFEIQKLNFPEYFTIMLFSVFSLLLLCNATDMISFYLLIETQSLAFYILAAFKRNSAFCVESGLKYFIAGSFITGIFLLGCSFLYGVLGTLNFNNLYLIFSLPIETSNTMYTLLIVGTLLITITFLFKLSSVPFHFWSPDVYDGSPLSTTIFFSIIPKFVTFYLFIKWLLILGNNFEEIKFLLSLLGILSLVIGTFFTLFQKRLKRFILYSSIAQTGFLISACSLLITNSITSIFFFLLIYSFTLLCLWVIFSISFLSQKKYFMFFSKQETPLFLSSLNNTFDIDKLSTLSFTIVFFSMAGLPPLSGFFSKVFILLDFISANFIEMAFILILFSSVSVFYYVKMVKVLTFESTYLVKKVEPSQIIYVQNKSLSSLVEFLSIKILLLLSLYSFEALLFCEYLALSFNYL